MTIATSRISVVLESAQTCSLNLLTEALRLLIAPFSIIEPETSSKKSNAIWGSFGLRMGDFIESSLRHCSYLRKIIFQLNNRVDFEPHPVKRTVKKYKISLVSSRALLAAFYAARQSVCFSIGVSTPRLRWTRLVL